MIRRLVLISLLVAVPVSSASCSQNPRVATEATAAVSHDTLAIAQDLEAQLCWGVPDAKHPPADPTRCTTQTAQTIGLTDARHRDINNKLAAAFELHKSLTALAKTGATADYSTLNAQLDTIIALIQQLQQTPQVTQLLNNVQGAKK